MGDLFNQIQNLPPLILESVTNQLTRIQLARRELYGWREVNQQIKVAPRCEHTEKIVICRCCPTCKKIEHNNSCNCLTSEDLEFELEAHSYDPTLLYFVKRVCKACKTRKKQNETAPAA